jgi:superfamily II DNA or RNA helicase
LTARGYLVPTRVFAPNKPDLRDVQKVGGDYNQRQLGRTMDKPVLTGDILDHWKRLGEDRQTVGFAVSVEHSLHLRDKFREAGIVAEHLDGETPVDERAAILRRLASGETQVLWSVGVLTEGVDIPSLGCLILARPTMSEGLYLQMAGRGLRPHPGKTDVVILDHAGCTLQHGFVDDDRNWELTKDRMRKASERIDTALTVKACPKCFQVARKDARLCTCGYVFHFEDRSPRQVAGTLTEARSDREKYMTIPPAGRKTCYLRWVAEGRANGYKANYAATKYFAVFRQSPDSEWMLEASLAAQRTEGSGELRIAR